MSERTTTAAAAIGGAAAVWPSVTVAVNDTATCKRPATETPTMMWGVAAVDDGTAATEAENGGADNRPFWGQRRCEGNGPASCTVDSCTASAGTRRNGPPMVPKTNSSTSVRRRRHHHHRRCGGDGATAVGSAVDRRLLPLPPLLWPHPESLGNISSCFPTCCCIPIP